MFYFLETLKIFHTFPTCFGSFGTTRARFNARGTQFLCRELSEFPVVYDVPTEQQMSVASSRKIQVSTPCNSGFHGNQRLCFAGQEYELFVSAESADHNLYIWSLPTDRQVGDQVIDQPLSPSSCWKDTKIQFPPSATTIGVKRWPLPVAKKLLNCGRWSPRNNFMSSIEKSWLS